MPLSIRTDAVPRDFGPENLATPEVIANPYPYYRALRDRSPIFGYRDLPPGTVPGVDEPKPSWAILKHKDVTQVSREPDIFSSRDMLQETSAAPTLMLVNHDRPRHTELRGIVQLAFTPQRINAQRDWVKSQVTRMLNEFPDGEVDVMDGIAPNLPAIVMAHLLGMPLEDFVKFRGWATAFMLSADLTPEERNASNLECLQYFTEKVTQRYADKAAGKDLPDDLLTALMTAEEEGKSLSQEEVIRFCLTLVVAGSETTTFLLGNLVWLLAEMPEMMAKLKADRGLIRPFIDEAFRFAGPPQRLFRVATQDTEIGGQKIREGDWVAVFFASANHDPEVWERPDEFILNRPNRTRHYSLGHGIHHCLGSPLAILEGECMLDAILDRYDRIEPGSNPFVRQTVNQLTYGLDRCNVIFRKD